MQINIQQDRMLVISDLHIGCSLFNKIQLLEKFFDFAKLNQFHVCINGDGLDFSQSTLMQMVRDAPIIFNQISQLRDAQLKVYYIVGNHDIVLEHFLQDWGLCEILPFMNLVSKDKRIRIEHGHIYDPLYVKSPDLYQWAEKFGGILLKCTPTFYHLYKHLEQYIHGNDILGTSGRFGEKPNYLRTVSELFQRGFDAVIFGHTHRPGVVKLGSHKTYINLGSWIHRPYFAKIQDGQVELLEFGGISQISKISPELVYQSPQL